MARSSSISLSLFLFDLLFIRNVEVPSCHIILTTFFGILNLNFETHSLTHSFCLRVREEKNYKIFEIISSVFQLMKQIICNFYKLSMIMLLLLSFFVYVVVL